MKSLKVSMIDSVGNMNACTNFHGYPMVWDISLKPTSVNLMVTLNEKSVDHQ